MKQRIRDGIYIDNSVYVVEDEMNKSPIYLMLCRFLAILIGGWSIVSIFIETFSIPVHKITVFTVLFFVCTGFFIMFIFPSYRLVKTMIFGLCYAFYLYSRLPRFINAFYIFENLVIDLLQSYYGLQTAPYIANYKNLTKDITLFVVLIFIPIIFIIVMAILRGKYLNLCIILMFVPFAACFAFGMVPSVHYLIAFILDIIYIVKTSSTHRRGRNKNNNSSYQRVHHKVAIWLCCLTLVLFFILRLFVTQEEYDGITKINELKAEIQTSLYQMTWEDVTKPFQKYTIFKSSLEPANVGGLSGGELGKVGEVKFTNSEQLRITAPYYSIAEGMYLKGYVGSVYTGDSWQGHSKEDRELFDKLVKKLPKDQFNSINQIPMLFDSIANIKFKTNQENERWEYLFKQLTEQGQIKIEYIKANNSFIYAPYYTDFNQMDDIKYLQDLYAAPKKTKNKYTLPFYFQTSFSDLADYDDLTDQAYDYKKYMLYEKLYRDFVYEVYTKLPEHGLDRLKEEFTAPRLKVFLNNVYQCIDYVKNYLNKNTSYSLSPGKLPDGKDFVEYFLYENHLGYCAHYASAATLMLRAMGIPARYVEGYSFSNTTGINEVINEDINELTTDTIRLQRTIMDYNAHAWVEVYMDGLGWIPFEVTPGSEVGGGAARNDTIVRENESEIKDQPEELKPDITKEPTIEPTIEPTKPADEVKPTTKPDNTSETGQGNTASSKTFKIPMPLKIIFIVGSLCAGFIAFVLIRRENIEKQNDTTSLKALYLYGLAEKLIKLCGGLPKGKKYLEEHIDDVKENIPDMNEIRLQSFIETAQKARFGRDNISQEELDEMEEFYQALSTETYSKSPKIRTIYIKLRLLI